MLGDFEMWHLLSQKYPVVLMTQGIVWYRDHDEQEMADHRSDPMQPFKYILLAENLIYDENCPMNESQKSLALKKIKHQKARAILSAAKHHSLSKSIEMYKADGQISIIETFKSI